MKVLEWDDLDPGKIVTIENGFFKQVETGEWMARGQGMAWIGPGTDLRGNLFKIVFVELPYIVLEWLTTANGDISMTPRRVTLDARHTKFREMSREFLESITKPKREERAAQQNNLSDMLSQMFGGKPSGGVTVIDHGDGLTEVRGPLSNLPAGLQSMLRRAQKRDPGPDTSAEKPGAAEAPRPNPATAGSSPKLTFENLFGSSDAKPATDPKPSKTRKPRKKKDDEDQK